MINKYKLQRLVGTRDKPEPQYKYWLVIMLIELLRMRSLVWQRLSSLAVGKRHHEDSLISKTYFAEHRQQKIAYFIHERRAPRLPNKQGMLFIAVCLNLSIWTLMLPAFPSLAVLIVTSHLLCISAFFLWAKHPPLPDSPTITQILFAEE